MSIDMPPKKAPNKKGPPKDYVGEALEMHTSGRMQYESPEDALLAALEMLTADEQGERLMGHRRKLRGEPDPEAPIAPEAELEADADALPPECEAGECEHPEHQSEDAFPEDI